MQMMVPKVPVAAAKRNCGRFPYFWARTETSGLCESGILRQPCSRLNAERYILVLTP